MAAWYIARNDELLIDMDRAFDVVRESTGATRFEMFFRRRLRDAERAGLLMVRKLVVEESFTPGNVHCYVQLQSPIKDLHRLIWQSWLGSDLYRSRTDMMRYANRHMYPSLLILPRKSMAWRDPDAECHCTDKHDTAELFENPEKGCKAWNKYRGPTPWECFGEPATDPDSGIIVTDIPFGKAVPLHLVRLI